MTAAPITLLQQAAELGLKLGFEPPDTLTVDPARLCSAEFAATLKAHKPALLALLRLPFVMVYSAGARGDDLLLRGRGHQSRAGRGWRRALEHLHAGRTADPLRAEPHRAILSR